MTWNLTKRRLKKLYDENRVKNDIEKSKSGQKKLKVLFDYIKKEQLPDQTIIEILTKILEGVITGEIEDIDEVALFMEIVSQLDEYDLRILFACYSLHLVHGEYIKENIGTSKVSTSYNKWLRLIVQESKLTYQSIVEIHSNMLVKKRLFSERQNVDGSGISNVETYRLTKLGLDLYKFFDSSINLS